MIFGSGTLPITNSLEGVDVLAREEVRVDLCRTFESEDLLLYER